ncbi:MAG: bifunctional demethylmenaquinone methyltransferase/2-methoxy-6-polyprenyl-1,4-benzoquinol methylase UbiE [Deltaproteobacteria bacterium]|nr:bifunctional demethylmenaquinone methyltransferase/2-methoxy-6-polyprenyl-1,4-benzoquinol methylase UbiE [Deltaproteobacteria bacterium]
MSRAVHDMFASIAGRYDLTNDVLCLGIHRLWNKTACDAARFQLGDRVLDLCTGTGAVAREAAARVGPRGVVFALDFVEQMLTLARDKPRTETTAPIHYLRADAGKLPVSDANVDAVTIAYGIRNVDDPVDCLTEIHRVLKPGGRVVVLEFGQPSSPLFGALFRFYSFHVMPWIGKLLTGNRAAYEYLPKTSAAFPSGVAFLELMRGAQFRDLAARPLFFGIAFIYSGTK